MAITKNDEKLLVDIRKQAKACLKLEAVLEAARKAATEAKARYDGEKSVLMRLVGATKEDNPIADWGESDGWMNQQLDKMIQSKHAIMLKKAKGMKTLGDLAEYMTGGRKLSSIVGIGEAVETAIMADVATKLARNKEWGRSFRHVISGE